jgi:hypothetical protein
VLIQDFNLCTPVGTTVLELAEIIWEKVHGSSKQFRYVSDLPANIRTEPQFEWKCVIAGFDAPEEKANHCASQQSTNVLQPALSY